MSAMIDTSARCSETAVSCRSNENGRAHTYLLLQYSMTYSFAQPSPRRVGHGAQFVCFLGHHHFSTRLLVIVCVRETFVEHGRTLHQYSVFVYKSFHTKITAWTNLLFITNIQTARRN
jgi:hypothetical protein